MYEIWAIPVPSDVQTVKIILILMILVSIKAYKEMNVRESLSLYQRLALAGWQLTPWQHFLSWGRVFLSQRHLVMQGCVLAAGTENRTEPVSSKVLKFSSERKSLNSFRENRSDMFPFSPTSLL